MKTLYVLGRSAAAFSLVFAEGIVRLGRSVLLLDDSEQGLLLQMIRQESSQIPLEDYHGVDMGDGEEIIPEGYDFVIYYSDSQKRIAAHRIDELYLVSGYSKLEMEEAFRLQKQYEGSWVLLKGIPQEKKSLSCYLHYFCVPEESEKKVRIIWFDYLDYRMEAELGFGAPFMSAHMSDSYRSLLTDWLSKLTGKTTREIYKRLKKKRGNYHYEGCVLE